MRSLLWALALAVPLAAQDFSGPKQATSEQATSQQGSSQQGSWQQRSPQQANPQQAGPQQSKPAPESAAMQAADEALAARDYPKAVKLLKPLAQAEPKNARLLYDLGSAQDALDQTSPAETSYRAAIDAEAGYLDPRVALGLMLARAGRMDAARTALLGAVAISNTEKLADADKPVRARALRALARIDSRARPGDARTELLAALAISPETPEDTLLAAELAERAGNGSDAAEAAYRRALAEAPNDPAATAGLAHLLAKEKKNEEAEKLLTAALAAHPNDAPMTIELASVYTAEDKKAEALPLIERLHAADPQEASVTRLLAELYVDDKQYAPAEPLLAGLCAQHPQDGELIDLRAQALLHLKRSVEAERILTQVVAEPADFKSTEEWGAASGDLAFAASQNDHPQIVVQVLANRAKVLPPSPPILFLLAISEDKLHHTSKAVQAYQDFVAASNGASPNEEFEARHRLIALEHKK